MKERDVLWENEVNSNKVMTSVLFASVGALGVICILLDAGFLYVPTNPRVPLLANMILMSVAGIISIRYKHDKRWLKYLLMGTLIVAYCYMDILFTYYAAPVMMIPVVLSSKYFIKKYTIRVTVVTFVLFFITAIIGARVGLTDLNSLELPAGTVIQMGENTWLSDAIEGYSYDKDRMVCNVLMYSYSIKFLLGLIVAVGCVRVSEQGHDLVFRQQELTEKTARTEADLSVAARIQTDVLPSKFPAFPERKEFDIYASMTPAKEVGGDFYDFFLVDEDHLYMTIADVSGKGIPAAMFMMAAKNILAEHARMGKTPAKILEGANRTLCINNTENMFVTAWVGILELSNGRMAAASAGHECQAVKTPEGQFKIFKDEHGFPLGWFDESEYKEYEMTLTPGTAFFSYTDGVTEAMDAEDKLFGLGRLEAALNADTETAPEKVLEKVRCGVADFVKDAEQFDDLTMLGLLYHGK